MPFLIPLGGKVISDLRKKTAFFHPWGSICTGVRAQKNRVNLDNPHPRSRRGLSASAEVPSSRDTSPSHLVCTSDQIVWGTEIRLLSSLFLCCSLPAAVGGNENVTCASVLIPVYSGNYRNTLMNRLWVKNSKKVFADNSVNAVTMDL